MVIHINPDYQLPTPKLSDKDGKPTNVSNLAYVIAQAIRIPRFSVSSSIRSNLI